jgi:5-methyltetrahydrofolate--homocysteine methyltransferase
MDDAGIPSEPERRVEIARTIASQAEELGIPRNDLIIDCLALPVGADARAALVTLQSIRSVREEMGVNMTLGASNVSFGLPEREVVNWAFLSLVLFQGVNCPIVDPAKVRPAILATDLLLGHDDFAMRYISAFRKRDRKA